MYENAQIQGNPNPEKFKIGKWEYVGNYLIVEINYPDCKNYEGNKLLVFEDLRISKLRTFKTIDPHFSNNKDFKSPVARMEPSKKGWSLARKICR